MALQAALEASEKSSLACLPCKLVFSYVQKHDFSAAYDKVSTILENFCDKYGILGDGVCEGALTEMGPYAVQNA